MTASFELLVGFSCCSMVILLYLLYQFIEVFKELVSILREFLENE